MTTEPLHIRAMTLDDMQFPIGWAQAEGWNPGLNDAACFHAADPEGFLLGEWEGRPVGCISAVRYGSAFGFMGFYLVRPEHRGKGFGLQLWDAAMRHLDGRNLGLDGVLAQQENYKRSGFTLAYRNIRFEGRGRGSDASAGTRPLADFPATALESCDTAKFGVARPAFLGRWVQQPEAVALAVGQGSDLRGYGVMRPCFSGYKIGPLFADSTEHAETLLDAFLGAAPSDAPVYFDTPEVNAESVRMAEARGMSRVFETARMYKGETPSLPLEQIFGVTSFELG